MKVRLILAKKGITVITITPDKQIRQAITILAEKNIRAINEITMFCHAYNENPEKALTNLGINRKKLTQ